MTQRKYFGTDGIRGRVGDSPITPEFMLHLGWAAGQAFKRAGQRNSVLIGKDTRLSGYMFESALEAGLAAAGVDVKLLGPMPTPAIAYLTRTFRASAGIVICASHIPHHDNGIKFFPPPVPSWTTPWKPRSSAGWISRSRCVSRKNWARRAG